MICQSSNHLFYYKRVFYAKASFYSYNAVGRSKNKCPSKKHWLHLERCWLSLLSKEVTICMINELVSCVHSYLVKCFAMHQIPQNLMLAYKKYHKFLAFFGVCELRDLRSKSFKAKFN